MGLEQTVSIKLPPDVLTKVEAIASQQGKTIDQWIASTVSDYVARESEWKSLLDRTHAVGKQMGIESEADVERILGEFRTEKRA